MAQYLCTLRRHLGSPRIAWRARTGPAMVVETVKTATGALLCSLTIDALDPASHREVAAYPCPCERRVLFFWSHPAAGPASNM